MCFDILSHIYLSRIAHLYMVWQSETDLSCLNLFFQLGHRDHLDFANDFWRIACL